MESDYTKIQERKERQKRTDEGCRIFVKHPGILGHAICEQHDRFHNQNQANKHNGDDNGVQVNGGYSQKVSER